MRQLIIFLILTTTFIYLKAQTVDPHFFGEKFQEYKGLVLKLKDVQNLATDFTYKFYSDLEYCQSMYDTRVIYPDLKYRFKTNIDSLTNRIFIVEDIVNKNGDTLTGSAFLFEPILVLRDTLTNEKIYYKYNQNKGYDFPFITSKDLLDKKTLCLEIESLTDPYTSVVKFHSPLSYYGRMADVVIYKVLEKKGTIYYLILKSNSDTYVVDVTGVKVLFTDGTQWTKPNSKIDVDLNDGFEYKAFITLSAADLVTFSTKKINMFELYIFNNMLSSFEADRFKVFVECIKESK